MIVSVCFVGEVLLGYTFQFFSLIDTLACQGFVDWDSFPSSFCLF